MRKVRISETILGFLLGVAVTVVILLSSSDMASHYEVCETTKEGAKECATYGVIHFAVREVGRLLDAYSAFITAVATAFIALFTLSLRQSTDRLWRAGDDQLQHAKTTASLQNDQTAESMKIAKRAADIADRGVILADRPWISIDLEIKGPLKFTATSVEIDIRGTFKNVGKSPASNVNFNFGLWAAGNVAAGEAHKAAKQIRHLPIGIVSYGAVLFPGADGYVEKMISIKLADFLANIDEIDSSITSEELIERDGRPFRNAYPAILAFAYYGLASAGSSGRYRCTTVISEIACTDPEHNGFDGSELEIAVDRLELVQAIFSGETT